MDNFIMDKEHLHYLEQLSEMYPTIGKASSEIINLQAILNLPKGTEHFVSDVHGEYEAFSHVLKNGSGAVRKKIDDVFGESLNNSDKSALATLIYYPREKMELVKKEESDMDSWYKTTLYKLIEVCKTVSSKYTRSKVRKALPEEYAYVIEELITEKPEVLNKEAYYESIINTTVELGTAEEFIVVLSELIQRLAVDHLHVLGDIYDRGAGPHLIMDRLCKYHSLDIQWGNHDIIWMGAAAGNLTCIATVVRNCIRYGNLDVVEEGYGINMLPLATFAIKAYKDDPCSRFVFKVAPSGADNMESDLIKKMHKAIAIIRETELDAEVVPNLMICFGIDQVQAEYVAEIKLRHLNREYILKRTEEIEELENAIEDLRDILNRPARINKIIMRELADVAKKYGKPRCCEILYELPAAEVEEPEQQVPDYPVNLFFTREGYFKKITPQSLRMSGEQKLKDGDEVLFTCETTNSVELLFFTNHHQVYKSHAYDFADSKASVLGDYVASSLGMDEGEFPLYMVVTPDYKGWMLFFFKSGKCAKVPLSSYETKQNRRKLLKAYSDKDQLAFMRYLPEETELAIFTSNNRLLLAATALIPEKTTRDSAGVNVVTLKKNAKITRITPSDTLELTDAHRYRVRTLPATGAIIRADDTAEQLTLG